MSGVRVLFVAIPSRPHVFPLIPLAWACRSAGHDVRVASGTAMADAVRHAGMPAVVTREPFDTRPRAGLRLDGYVAQPAWPADWPVRPELLSAEQRRMVELVGQNVVALSGRMLDEVMGFAREWRPDLVVYDSASVVGEVVAAALAIPSVRHLPGAPGMPRWENRDLGDEPLPDYAGLFGRLGARPRRPSLTVDPCPPSIRLPVPQPCALVRYVPYNGAGTVPEWLRPAPRRPRVCVTFGHTVGTGDRVRVEPYRAAVDAIADLRVEMVLVTTAPQVRALGTLPANARVAESAPLHLVLPFCDAVVHQAGAGTLMTAAACGTPQVAITSKPEPTNNARRVAAVGAGTHLLFADLAGNPDYRAVIARSVASVLDDPAYARAAGELRDDIGRQPPPATLVPRLEDLGAVRGDQVAGVTGSMPARRTRVRRRSL